MADWLFARGHAADLILAVLAAEWCWLVRVRRWPLGAATLRLLPGALMIVALRAALGEAPWPWIALALAGSFPAHLADLARSPPRRLRQPPGRVAINAPSGTRSRRRASAGR